MKNSKNVIVPTVNDVVFTGVVSFIESLATENWTGTMTQLNARLTRTIGKRQAQFLPGSPSALRVVLNRIVARLRKQHIRVSFGRETSYNRTRFVSFSR